MSAAVSAEHSLVSSLVMNGDCGFSLALTSVDFSAGGAALVVVGFDWADVTGAGFGATVPVPVHPAIAIAATTLNRTAWRTVRECMVDLPGFNTPWSRSIRFG